MAADRGFHRRDLERTPDMTKLRRPASVIVLQQYGLGFLGRFMYIYNREDITF
jgi:hypothetical protein